MNLDPPRADLSAYSSDSLLEKIQQHAEAQGYAVVFGRTKRNKKTGERRRAWIRCDRGGEPEKNSKSMDKRVTDSRLIDCPFQIIASSDEDGLWTLDIRNTSHTHPPITAGAHASHRVRHRTRAMKAAIINQSKAGSKPSTILSGLLLDGDEENPFILPQDIYNIKRDAKAEELGSLTQEQALMRNLHQRFDWFVRVDKHQITDRIENLFFARKSSQQILKLNHEVLILDCTYKTNRYKLPLMVITGVTGLNSSFYVGFAFMKSEFTKDYQWVMQALKELYDELDLPYPEVLLTDCEFALIRASGIVFPEAQRIVCIWHIDNNVLKKCALYFRTKDEWEAFFAHWHRVMYATTEQIFDDEWDKLQDNYINEYPDIITYLQDNVIPFKTRFASCWTNQLLTFGNRATSRGESNNGRLKDQIHGVSIGKYVITGRDHEANYYAGDLKYVVDQIEILLTRERTTYNIKFGQARMKIGKDIKVAVFRDLLTKVTPFALRQILPQYQKVIHHQMKPCTGVFTKGMGLPCSHKIEARMNGPSGILHIDDVHPHWRFEKPIRPGRPHLISDGDGDEPPSDTDRASMTELLRVREPTVIKPKGRPFGARNKVRNTKGNKRTQEQAFEESTSREPSGFEHVVALQQYRLALTASQVEEQDLDRELDAYYGPGDVGGTTPVSTPTSTPMGGARAGSTPRGGAGTRGGYATSTPRSNGTSAGAQTSPAPPRGNATAPRLLAVPARRRRRGTAGETPRGGRNTAARTRGTLQQPAGFGNGTHMGVYDPEAW